MSTSNLCDHCHQRPKYSDGSTTYPYCGGTCAMKAKPLVSRAPNGASNLCEHCHLRPKYHDGSTTYPFCGGTCAMKAKPPVSRSSTSVSSTVASSNKCDNCKVRAKHRDSSGFTHPFCGKACATSFIKKPTGTTSATKGICQIPGCQKPAFTNTDGTLADYCSQVHKTLGETACLMCHQAPKLLKSHFCSQKCTDEADLKGPMILDIPKGHVTFKSVEEQFKTSWRHTGKACPRVRRIYKVITPQTSQATYNSYRAAVEARGRFEAAGRSAGNENRRWHGTRRECNIGDKGCTAMCSSNNCPLCSIIRTSYDLSKFGSKTGWGRFGKGIYTSSTSSKSDDYASCDKSSKLTGILLNKVVVGRGHKLLFDSTSLTAPPPGYDSVLAEKGGSLNYDELVVYKNDAIRPSYLVMYEA